MLYRKFGKTGISVSVLSLGTVEFGLPYGFYHPQESAVPEKREALKILLSAFQEGVNLLDTAPAYGDSETVVGAALREWGQEGIWVATKIPVGQEKGRIQNSLEGSIKRLQKETLDLVQLHNPTAEDLRCGRELEELQAWRQKGRVRWIGASVYGLDAAQEALLHTEVDVLQVAGNLLDQRMAETILQAGNQDVGVMIRSVLLKGVLSERRSSMPPQWSVLMNAADRAHRWAQEWGLELPVAAIRFCLEWKGAGSVLLGVRNLQELESGLIAVSEGLPMQALREARQLHIKDSSLTDPRTWQIM